MSPTWRRAKSRCARRSRSPSAFRASPSTMSGQASPPAGWSATSPMSRSSLAGTRSSSRTSTSCSRAGKGAIDRNGQVVLHAHPALYTIDGVEGVHHPIGLHADRLGVDIHVVAADPAPLRNIDYVIRSAHLGVKAIVASPVAAALACLTPEERELGVALVELGAEVTNVSLHAGGMLVGLRSIPLGRQGHHRRHRLRLRCAAARGGADEMPLRLGDDQPARQSRNGRGDADRRRRWRRAAPHHPRPADHRHPPADRGNHQRDRERR